MLRASLTSLPDGLTDIFYSIFPHDISNESFLYLSLAFGIIIIAWFGKTFCLSVRFVPYTVSLNMLSKRVKISYRLAANIILSLLYTLFCYSLTLNDLGSFVHLVDFTYYDGFCLNTWLLSILIYNSLLKSGTFIIRNMLVFAFRTSTEVCLSHDTALWIINLTLLLSSDVHPNPGPNGLHEFSNGFLSFCNWNLNTLSKDNFCRVSLLEAHNVIFNYDIISLCETSLNDDVQVPENILPGYLYHPLNHPDNKRSGGVGIFYKDTLPLRIRSDLSFDECLVCELKFGRKKIFFTVFYRNPENKDKSEGFENFLENFEQLHRNISKENPYASFFTGDINAHTQAWYPAGNTNAEGIRIDELFSNLNLTQIINEPTHFFRNDCTPSCIDIILTDQPNLVLDSGVRPSLDPAVKHHLTYCKLNFKIPPPPKFCRKIYHYSRAQQENIVRSIRSFPWATEFRSLANPTQKVSLLNKTLHNIMSNFIPNENRTFRPRDPPWFTREIKNGLKKHNKIYKKFKLNGFKDEDKIPVDNSKLRINEMILNAKEQYLVKQGEKLADPSTGSKTYWKILNTFLNKCKVPRIPPLFDNSNFLTDCKEKATLFNEYFAKQCTPFETDSILPTLNFLTTQRLSRIDISVDDVQDILKVLKSNKAHGPDEISVAMIKLCSESICLPLQIIFQDIIESGSFPDQWKEANVTPVHKKKDKQTVSNYRPISLLPLFAKVFERIVFKNLYNFLISNKLITKNQSGFTPGDSGTNQLLSLINDIHKAFDDNRCLEVRSVYLDMSKAFDKVWHEGLLFKLKQNGIDGKLLQFFQSYLSNRRQRVVLNGRSSDWAPIQSGVPQGSVLGPLLFLIYINDLECGIKSQIKFFADDTSLYSVVTDPITSAAELNHDLEIINNWAKQWKMSFNPDPTKPAEEILFSQKKSTVHHPPLFFNGSEVKRVTDHKHLGLILDPKLNFAAHINEKAGIARKGIGLIKHLRSYLPTEALMSIYTAHIRSHLDYCDFIYHIPALICNFSTDINLNFVMQKLESLQYQAGLAITGMWQCTNRDKVYDELGWEPLHLRRYFRRLTQFYKIVNGLTPPYLAEPVPPPRSHLYGTSVTNDLHPMKCRTQRFKNSFYPNAVECWNNIGPEIRKLATLSSFKSMIMGIIKPKKKEIFKTHSPHLKYLYQLRVGHSALKAHKFRHGFKDTPSDKCTCSTGSESTLHFLLSCPMYNAQRGKLLETVTPILDKVNSDLNDSLLEKVLLYGDSNLNPSQNKIILDSTLNFIQETGRFTNDEE